MKVTISKWGNSLAVRIPVEMARKLKLVDGIQVECTISANGVLELAPPIDQNNLVLMKKHLEAVRKRLAISKATTPFHLLLKEEERY